MSQKVLWGLLGGLFLIVLLFLLTTMGDYLGASLLWPDRGTDFSPLVRHEISQLHCYDDGSNFCERQSPQPFEKEFTIGYLSTENRRGRKTLYSCVNRKNNFYHATFNRKECPRGSSTKALGYVFSDSNVEAPVSLYRCLGPVGQDTLLTDDSNECALLGYQKQELLGYIPSAGHLPQRRLNELCATIVKHCTISTRGALGEICAVHTGLCKGPEAVSTTPLPTPTPTPPWR